MREDVRGQGVGKALVARLIEVATAAGLRQMIAVIGDSENVGSIGVHASLGFHMVGTMKAAGIKFGRWLDVVTMQRPLGKGDANILPDASDAGHAARRGDGGPSACAALRSTGNWLAMAAYGFVSGLPLPLSGFTFRLWLSDSGAALAVIGLTACIGLAYSLKFLWAPLLDQTPPPGPLRRFGRRRGWLLLIQPALGLAAVLLALSNPAAAPLAAFAAAALVAFLSASQDIAIDAWRIEIFPARRQGAGAGGLCLGLPGRAADLHHRRDRARPARSAGTRRCWAWRR